MKKMFMWLMLFMFMIAVAGCGNEAAEGGPEAFSDYDALADYLRDLDDEGSYFGIDAYPEAGVDSTTDQRATDDYSTTNVQVEGVSEADRVLTDGTSIFVSADRVVHVIDADDLTISFTAEYDRGWIRGLYLSDDRLIVITHMYPPMDDDDDVRTDDAYVGGIWWMAEDTVVDIFDVSDTDDVTLERTLTFPRHRLFDSRMIDGRLFLMMNRYIASEDLENDTFMPAYRDSVRDGETIRVGADDVHRIPAAGQLHYLVLADVDVADDAEPNVKAYLGSAHQVYMSLTNLYVTVPVWTYDEETDVYDRYTSVLRFAVQDDGLIYRAEARVDGHPLNQFSMDEHDGVFRIATSEWLDGDDDYANRVYVLDATTEETMEQWSVVEDLGKPGEQIYAVRFQGDIAYVVTFEQIDPLYKLDLSDPGDPVVLGEFEEEGVSDYLHPITDGLMVGVGRMAETIDGATRFTGVKITLYDTTDDEPLALDVFEVEGEYSHTPVIYDHHAFVYFERPAENKTYIAVPIVSYGRYWENTTQGVYVFAIDYEGTMEQLAYVSHETESYYDSIDRSLFIGERFFTVSRRQIRMFDVLDGFTHVDTVVFPDMNDDEDADK